MKIFSQRDPKWKDKKLGTGDKTIGNAGCFLTCFAMLLDVEPDKVNDRMVIFGGFIGSEICPGVIPNAYKQVYFDSQTWCAKTPAPLAVIDAGLMSSKAVIVQLDTSPVEGIQSHFVILTGKVGNDYEMIDPWPLVDIPRGTVINRYGKDTTGKPRKIEEVITYVAVLGGADMSSVGKTAPPGDTEPLPELGESLTTTVAGMRLRASAGLSGRIICELPLGVTLTRNQEVEVIKDGFRWSHVDLWVATGKADGSEIYAK